jgi:hypothetical protein
MISEGNTIFLKSLNNRELSFFYEYRLKGISEQFQKEIKDFILEKTSPQEIKNEIRKPTRPRKTNCARCGSEKLIRNQLQDDECQVCLFITKRNSCWKSLGYFLDFLLQFMSGI